MATRQAYKRLTREYKNIEANPVPYITAKPDEANILVWHYIIDGPPDTPYANGQYHGTLTFPPDYPFKPPAIRMFTPSARFQPNMRLCLSISDYHPKTWNPAWSAATILTGLLSFMVSDEVTAGSVPGTPEKRKLLAAQSRVFNNASEVFRAQFPEVVKQNLLWKQDTGNKGNKVSQASLVEEKKKPGKNKECENANLSQHENTDTESSTPTPGMSLTHKLLCATLLLVSWVVAARLFS